MCGAGGSGGPDGRAPECQHLLTTRRDRQYKQELKSWPRAGLEVPRASSEPRARWQGPRDILRTKHADSSLPRWARARQWEGVLECMGPRLAGATAGLGMELSSSRWSQTSRGPSVSSPPSPYHLSVTIQKNHPYPYV